MFMAARRPLFDRIVPVLDVTVSCKYGIVEPGDVTGSENVQRIRSEQIIHDDEAVFEHNATAFKEIRGWGNPNAHHHKIAWQAPSGSGLHLLNPALAVERGSGIAQHDFDAQMFDMLLEIPGNGRRRQVWKKRAAEFNDGKAALAGASFALHTERAMCWASTKTRRTRAPLVGSCKVAPTASWTSQPSSTD